MTDHHTLLTIDCDWAVTPTPVRDNPDNPADTDEPPMTLEHMRYPYAARPADDCHHMSITPSSLVSALRVRGLSRARHPLLTERHGGVREVWEPVLNDVDHIVCLDAHLDIYAIGSVAVTLRGTRGHKLRVEYRPRYRDMAAGLPSMRFLDPPEAETARQATWEEAWLLHLLDSMPRLTRFTWVVPQHFAVGLATGFPYDYAQWFKTIEEGRREGIWNATTDAVHQRLELDFLETELADRHLSIHVATLETCPSLDHVDADYLHVCRSPGFLPPSADRWVDDLVARLCAE